MFGRRRAQSDFSEELRAHLELETDRLRAEGMGESQAREQARRNLGNVFAAEERFYENERWLWLEQLKLDTRLALRRLRQTPVFAITAILTLALGIGATTAIFTLVHAVILKSLSVENPHELYRLGKRSHCCVWGGFNQSQEFSIVSFELYRHFRDHTPGFAELAAFEGGSILLGVRREGKAETAESIPAEFVSGNYFAMFGVKAYAGRMLTGSDDRPEAPPAAVISNRLWQARYGRDPTVIGGIFQFNDKAFTVVGVTPPAFEGDSLRNPPTDIFLPLATEPMIQGDSSILRSASSHWLDLIGRIKPGVSPTAIQAQMRVELQQWLHSHLGEMDANTRTNLPQQTLYLSPGGSGITGMREQYEDWLEILMIVSGFVLLIVCANIANLLLVRSLGQRGQTALSMALGARSSRLIRQALTENLVLALLGGAAGLAVAFAGTRVILDFAFPRIGGIGSTPISASPSLPVLAFAFGISLLTGVVFGTAPAWMATRIDPIEALRGANRSTNRAGALPRKTLVVFQAALALMLISASGLLTTTLRRLENQNFGFEQERRTVLSVDPLLAGYRADQLPVLYRRLHDSSASIPGVSSVALCLYSPLGGDSWVDRVFVDGAPPPGPRDSNAAAWDRVTPGYFEAIENRIVKGRPISEQDTATSRHVAVVNEAFARKFFRNADPIGRHFGRTDLRSAREYEVIGVARDARYLPYDLDQPIGPFFFVPASQSVVYPNPEDTVGEVRSLFLHDIVIKTNPGVSLSDAELRRAVAAADPKLPVIFIRSLKEQVAGNFGQQRLIARLTSLFGILAVILASVGLYGVTAYNAGSRTNEIGIRMALGADRGNVVAMVLRGAFVLIGLGLVIGAPLALSVGRVLGSQLYGVNPYDPWVITSAVAVLGSSALIASVIPALRASMTSPSEALRAQ